jgi:hypothetical protein
MMQADSRRYLSALTVSERLRAARSIEPHPLHPFAGEVETYVAELQQVDRDLDELLLRAGETLPAAEIETLRRKKSTAGAAIRRQALLAGRRMGSDREGSMAVLNSIFKLGLAPETPVDGVYRGDLITPTLFAPLDTFGRSLSRLWLPWLGKRFNALEERGDNIFTPSAKRVGRLFWPTYSDYRPYSGRLVTSFDFRTYTGPGIEDPEISTLKLDYSSPENPGFLVRSVIDELVQVSSNFYLGKAFLRKRGGGHRLAAFFALRREE